MSVTNQKTYGNKGTNSEYQMADILLKRKFFNRLTATGGCEYVDGAVTGKKYYAFVVQGDTQLSVLKGGIPPDTTKNYLTLMNLSGKTLKQGALIVVEDGEFITDITVTTGALLAYKLKNL